MASIEQQGQLMPVVAVPEADKAGPWVLIDGYRRREALQRLGADRIWVDVWQHSVDEALPEAIELVEFAFNNARKGSLLGSMMYDASTSTISLFLEMAAMSVKLPHDR